ncbi:hypothetical protein [Pontibacter burrus]|uniref:NlpE C-terminal OB domain-containing protein n=1 Tax=Pontibacter burrus TaxID=2704466 RepID=A0A6B3LJ42_9BACT|nr:hypothetical protein [Pontibacter burrus]NEM97002.1 hypothetical protein [Pontibacter burrus]
MKTKLLTATVFALCSMFAFSSCDSEDDVDLVLTDGRLYFEAEMNGKMLLLPEGKDGYVSKAFVQTEATTAGCAEIQQVQLARNNEVRKSIQIAFIEQRTSCKTNCDKSKAMLHTGNYSFGRLKTYADVPMADGVVIRYTDIDGKVWSTDYGTADQNNSSFMVTDVNVNTADKKSLMLVTAEFNCTLYDEAGSQIQITNGKVVSRSIVCE